MTLVLGCVGSLELEQPAPEEEPGVGPDAGDALPSEPVPDPACDELVATAETGEHNPGQPCLDCHRAGGEGPTFSVGGTLFRDAAGSAAVAGVTLHIVDATGKELSLVSARNGNFWSSQPVTYPLSAAASGCPSRSTMAAPIQQGGGNCNSGGCHDGDFRVFLP